MKMLIEVHALYQAGNTVVVPVNFVVKGVNDLTPFKDYLKAAAKIGSYYKSHEIYINNEKFLGTRDWTAIVTDKNIYYGILK
jgi:hypothetical protein